MAHVIVQMEIAGEFLAAGKGENGAGRTHFPQPEPWMSAEIATHTSLGLHPSLYESRLRRSKKGSPHGERGEP